MTRNNGAENTAPVTVNGWSIFLHQCFSEELTQLMEAVEALQAKDPDGYVKKSATKLLAAISKLAFKVVPQNPGADEYRLSKSLGDSYQHWRRAKFFQQYRLFFRYHTETKVIICAWVNGPDTKRAYGSKTDAYRVFNKMLAGGNPPDNWNVLLTSAKTKTGAA
ncbi:MAG TPA: type II toxin-antitoxin system YhaV family toxin [Steroidobacteraceae bacterium]